MRPSPVAARLRRKLLALPAFSRLPKCEACGKQVRPERMASGGICIPCAEEYEAWLDEQDSLRACPPMFADTDAPFLPEDDQ